MRNQSPTLSKLVRGKWVSWECNRGSQGCRWVHTSDHESSQGLTTPPYIEGGRDMYVMAKTYFPTIMAVKPPSGQVWSLALQWQKEQPLTRSPSRAQEALAGQTKTTHILTASLPTEPAKALIFFVQKWDRYGAWSNCSEKQPDWPALPERAKLQLVQMLDLMFWFSSKAEPRRVTLPPRPVQATNVVWP